MTATLLRRPTAHSLRVNAIVEAQHRMEIAARIRDLRENSAETNRSIAEYVGVGERSVAAWVAGGGIAYENAKKVAELFEVDIDWLWRGKSGPAPDVIPLLSPPNGEGPADQILAELAKLAEAVESLADDVQELERRIPNRRAKPGAKK